MLNAVDSNYNIICASRKLVESVGLHHLEDAAGRKCYRVWKNPGAKASDDENHLLQAVMPKNILMETDLPAPGPAIRANANQIQQVLTNLVTNAWEAMPEGGGAIRLTVKTVSPEEIPPTNRFPIDWRLRDERYACLEVADTGRGIEEQDMEKLFDPFFSTKFTGRGLGLPVVVGIAGAHGGLVTVESGVGGRRSEDGRRRSEGRGRKAEVRGRRRAGACFGSFSL